VIISIIIISISSSNSSIIFLKHNTIVTWEALAAVIKKDRHLYRHLYKKLTAEVLRCGSYSFHTACKLITPAFTRNLLPEGTTNVVKATIIACIIINRYHEKAYLCLIVLLIFFIFMQFYFVILFIVVSVDTRRRSLSWLLSQLPESSFLSWTAAKERRFRRVRKGKNYLCDTVRLPWSFHLHMYPYFCVNFPIHFLGLLHIHRISHLRCLLFTFRQATVLLLQFHTWQVPQILLITGFLSQNLCLFQHLACLYRFSFLFYNITILNLLKLLVS